MLTNPEMKRISNLEPRKQARLSMCRVGGVGQPRRAGYGAACRTVHSRKRCKQSPLFQKRKLISRANVLILVTWLYARPIF
jgi:hypothetical protein